MDDVCDAALTGSLIDLVEISELGFIQRSLLPHRDFIVNFCLFLCSCVFSPGQTFDLN